MVLGVIVIFAIALLGAKKDDTEFTAKRGIVFDPKTHSIHTEGEEWKSTIKVKTEPRTKKGKSLEQQLDEALADEKYEEAAKLRDQINKKKK